MTAILIRHPDHYDSDMRRSWAAVLVVLMASGAAPASAALPEGSAHLEDVRVFATFDEPYRVEDLSVDGRYAVYSQFSDIGNEVGIIDLVDETITPLADLPDFDSASLSPDAGTILIREGRVLRLLDVDGGDIGTLGQSPPFLEARWLDDGRAAWFNTHRRLKAIGEDGIEDLGFTLPVTERKATSSLDADASAVLYSDGCKAWMTELGGEPDRLARGYVIPERAWAPDGEHFVIQQISSEKCRFLGPPPVRDVLFESDGTRIGRILSGESVSHGHSLYWSRDSRWLLIASQWTGSQVEGIRPLYAVSLEDMTWSRLLNEGLVGGAFVGPGDWVVYSTYNSPGEGASTDDRSGATYVAQLVD